MILNRRNFLQSSSIAALPWLLPSLIARAADENQSPATKMKLGLVTYQWGKNWDVPTLIKNCEAARFQGVELRSTHKHGVELTLNAEERANVKRQFEDSSVAAVGIGSACEYHSPDPEVLKKNIEETKQYVILSHDIGGTGVKVRPNGLPKGVPVEKTIAQIGRALNEVAQFAQEHGQEIRVEVHGRGTQEFPVFAQIMQAADHKNAGVCWNCNPADLKGEGLKKNFESVEDKIRTVHIHDLTKDNYPWSELFTLLKGIHFDSWTLVEDAGKPDDIVEAMKANRVAWEKLVANS